MGETSVYVIKLFGQVVYVGITSKGVADRWKRHREARGSLDTALARAMRKHGIENFECEETLIGLTWEQACEEEKSLIAFFGTRARYNMTDGGDGLVCPSSCTRGRMSAARTGKHSYTPSRETREKIAASKRGNRFTAEHKAKLSDARRRQPPASAERRAKVSAKNSGKVNSPETREKMAVARQATVARRQALGICMTPEQRVERKREQSRRYARERRAMARTDRELAIASPG